jgi:phage tail-like protein
VRAGIDGLLSPHPLGRTLPVVFREDDFTQRFCAGLDDVLAPVLATLDSLPAYFDPATAPEDMLAWLATWMGIVVDGHQSPARQRRLVHSGAEILRWRGTVRGVREAVRGLFGADPEIAEPGGSRWSASAGSPLPPPARADLLVRLAVPDPETFDLRRLDALVALVKPAHLEHRVEVFPR